MQKRIQIIRIKVKRKEWMKKGIQIIWIKVKRKENAKGYTFV